MQRLPQVTGRGSLPAASEKSNIQRALDDRMSFSEVTEIAAALLDQFPNSKNSADGFIGSIAQIFTQYPRQIILKCSDPLHGVAAEHEFLSIASLIAWLEKATEPMRANVAREQRIKEQFRALDEWKNEKPSERLKAMAEAWLDRSDPLAKYLTVFNSQEAQARKNAGLERVQEANQSVFERECKANGIDPAKGVSPSLIKTLEDAQCGTES